MLGNAQTKLISAEHILAGVYEKSGNEGVSQGLLEKNVANSFSSSEALDFYLYL
jgi:hypothetical protein